MHERNRDRHKPYPDNIIAEIGVEGLTGERLGTAMASGLLTGREKDVLDRYYRGGERYQDIGADYGVTKERARQVTELGLSKLRRRFRMENLAARCAGGAS